MLAAVSCIVAVALLVRKYNRLKVARAFYVPAKEESVQVEKTMAAEQTTDKAESVAAEPEQQTENKGGAQS